MCFCGCHRRFHLEQCIHGEISIFKFGDMTFTICVTCFVRDMLGDLCSGIT